MLSAILSERVEWTVQVHILRQQTKNKYQCIKYKDQLTCNENCRKIMYKGVHENRETSK